MRDVARFVACLVMVGLGILAAQGDANPTTTSPAASRPSDADQPATQQSKPIMRLVRLQYSGGDWDLNFGKGADENMLVEYAARTKSKAAANSEKISFKELAKLKAADVPPLLYVTGSGRFVMEKAEAESLTQYLTTQHGMLFADAGSLAWARTFKTTMKSLLPETKPTEIPADDSLLQQPNVIKSLPFAAPHDQPLKLLGWKVDGRWVAIYHPGDLGDIWKDGHSGVAKDTTENAYNLGVNIMHYAQETHTQRTKPKKTDK